MEIYTPELYISCYRIQRSKPLESFSPISPSTPSKRASCGRKDWSISENINYKPANSYSWLMFSNFDCQRLGYNTVQSCRNLQMFQTKNLPPPSALMIEATDPNETSVNFNKTQRHCIPGGGSLHSPPYCNRKKVRINGRKGVTCCFTSWINLNVVA